MVPDCLYLSGSAAAIVSSLARLRSSGAGTVSSADELPPAELAAEPAEPAAAAVVEASGAVVLAPHPASRINPSAAAVHAAARREVTTVLRKVLSDHGWCCLPGQRLASCHAKCDPRITVTVSARPSARGDRS